MPKLSVTFLVLVGLASLEGVLSNAPCDVTKAGDCDKYCEDRYGGRRNFYNFESNRCQPTKPAVDPPKTDDKDTEPTDKDDGTPTPTIDCSGNGTYDATFGICLCKDGFSGKLCENKGGSGSGEDSDIGDVVVIDATDLYDQNTPKAVRDAQERQLQIVYVLFFVLFVFNAILCCLSIPIQRRQKKKDKEFKKQQTQAELIAQAKKEID